MPMTSEYQYFIDAFTRFVYNLCMMPVMVKEADLNRIEVPEDYEVLDAMEDHEVVQSTLL